MNLAIPLNEYMYPILQDEVHLKTLALLENCGGAIEARCVAMAGIDEREMRATLKHLFSNKLIHQIDNLIVVSERGKWVLDRCDLAEIIIQRLARVLPLRSDEQLEWVKILHEYRNAAFHFYLSSVRAWRGWQHLQSLLLDVEPDHHNRSVSFLAILVRDLRLWWHHCAPKSSIIDLLREPWGSLIRTEHLSQDTKTIRGHDAETLLRHWMGILETEEREESVRPDLSNASLPFWMLAFDRARFASSKVDWSDYQKRLLGDFVKPGTKAAMVLFDIASNSWPLIERERLSAKWQNRSTFVDRTLKCIDCGANFIFTAGEQLFFHDKEFKGEPKRCKNCKARRAQMLGLDLSHGRDSYTRVETKVICSGCQRETTVPFKPTEGRPVFCRECFQQRKNAAASA